MRTPHPTLVALVTLCLVAPAGAQVSDLLVSSRLGNRVLRFDGGGAFASQFDPGAPLTTPNGVLVRGPHVYVSSRDGTSILRYFLDGGAFDRVFATGNGEMIGPSGIVFGPDGDLFVANSLADNIARYDGVTGALLTMTSTAGVLSAPVGIAFGPDGDLYVTGAVNNAFARYDGTTLAFEQALATGGLLGNPADVKLGPDGRLYIASPTQNRIARFDVGSGVMSSFLFNGQLGAPVGLTFAPNGELYVAGFAADKVSRVSAAGVFLGNHVVAGTGGLDGPQFLTFVPEPAAALPVAMSAMALSLRGRARRVSRFNNLVGSRGS